jgi:hypothetical protein
MLCVVLLWCFTTAWVSLSRPPTQLPTCRPNMGMGYPTIKKGDITKPVLLLQNGYLSIQGTVVDFLIMANTSLLTFFFQKERNIP